MEVNKKTARLAGALYLIVVLTGIFSLAYVPGQLIVWDNAATTFNNIIAAETLYRLGIVSSLLCYIAFLFLVLVLYRLLHAVNKTYAVAMVALALVSVPLSLYNLVHKSAVLTLIGHAEQVTGMALTQLQEQGLFYLRQYNNGIQLIAVFWGLWLFPFGYLVYKSGFLPKIFGLLLMAGCFGYLINFTGNFFFKHYGALGISSYVSLPATLGEIGICLWLLIAGIKSKTIISDTNK